MVTALALVIASRYGNDTTSTSPAVDGTGDADGLVVVAEDIAFGETAYSAAAGAVPVTYRNDGSIRHTLVIEDVDGFKLEVASTDDVDEGTVELDSGEYTLFCDVPGHRSAGMEATLRIE